MRKWKATACFSLLLTVILIGCKETKPEETTLLETEASSTVTTAPESLPTQSVPAQKWISQEEAMIEGFVVIQDGDVRHNQNRWQIYMDAVERKEISSVTVMHYIRTETGYEQIRYHLSYDGSLHHLSYMENGAKTEKTYTQLLKQQVILDDSWEPYDYTIRYLLANDDNEDVLIEDLIAETELDGVSEFSLYLKEGEPALNHYQDSAQVNAVLSLLNQAEYLFGAPENYYYGAKLIMTNGKGEQLVLELDLNQGNYRYGMQTYCYGKVSDLLNLLGLEKWPKEIYAEHGIYIE